MKCLEARQLFSAHLDGELAPAEGELLRAHLAECGACAADFELERAVSLVLRESAVADPLTRQSGYPRVPRAPEGFARGVTARLKEGRRGRLAGLAARWRPALAAAAAFIMIATASLGYGVQQWLARGPAVAQGDPPGTTGELVGPAGGVPAAPVTERPGGTGQGGETPGVAPGGTDAAQDPAETGTDAGTAPREGRDPGPVQIAAVPDVEQKVFLNKPRSIESTLIKLNVDHPAQVRDQALLAAGDAGAVLQSQAAQSGTVEVLRFYVDPGKAEQFTNRLADLGRVAGRQSDSRDITRQFASTLEQYQEAVAQRNRAADPEERAALDARISSLEQWLTEHDREAEEHVVVLVLQQN